MFAEDPWPLPWYLRSVEARYWKSVMPVHHTDMVIVSESLRETAEANLGAAYDMTYYGQRPGVLLAVFTRRQEPRH